MPAAALKELQAGIYLDPGLIAPESLARGGSESVTIYNDYIEALRATMPAAPATLKSATGAHGRAASPASRGAG